MAALHLGHFAESAPLFYLRRSLACPVYATKPPGCQATKAPPRPIPSLDTQPRLPPATNPGKPPQTHKTARSGASYP